jgi:hypothetical protein
MSTQSLSPDARRLRFRKLRIAWSVGCGIACLLLIALWVRSYQYCDRSSIVSRVFGFSTEGVLIFEWTGNLPLQQFFNSLMKDPSRSFVPQKGFLGFSTEWHPDIRYVQAPHWFPVSLATTLAALPWIHWRFSLRTLLIATTLMAVILGLIVYAVK